LFGGAQISLNAKFLDTLTYKKKSPTGQEGDCGATGFGFLLGGKNEELMFCD
jgi:hypothetical protein